MIAKTIAVIAMGDMGHAVARVLKEHGYEIVTCLAKRSDTSRQMAERAGARDVKDMVGLVTEADIFLSILPPAAALDLARDVAIAVKSVGTTLTYVDCNAVSPEYRPEIAGVINDVGALFIDAGIIGHAPGKAVPRFYVSGPDTAAMENLRWLWAHSETMRQRAWRGLRREDGLRGLDQGHLHAPYSLLMAAKVPWSVRDGLGGVSIQPVLNAHEDGG